MQHPLPLSLDPTACHTVESGFARHRKKKNKKTD
jgi:hypothetical protein